MIDFASGQAYNPAVVVPPVAAAHQSMELTAPSDRCAPASRCGWRLVLGVGCIIATARKS